MELRIRHQPKQAVLEEAILHSRATVIGFGGSRGGAKSGGIRRIAVELAHLFPGTKISIWMRNYDAQLKPNHIDAMLRDFPEFQPHYKITDKELHFPWCSDGKGGHSIIKFSYADTIDDLKKKTYGPEYQFIFVDQAEQFTESEIQALRMCNRAPNTGMGKAKIILAFNPGGIGFAYLKRIFWDRDYHVGEHAEDYLFVRAFVWDNIEWSRQALEEDGLTEEDYYQRFTEEQRKQYTISRSQYGKVLNALPPDLREPMLNGSMEVVAGQYFQAAFDRQRIEANPYQISSLVKPWFKRWMSGDWGFGHYSAFHWHARGLVMPDELNSVLELKTDRPLSVVVTYREWVTQGDAEFEIAQSLIGQCDEQERGKAHYSAEYGLPEKIKAFYFSPDAFEMSIRRSGQNSIADEIGKVLRAGGLPYPSKANNARVSGWRAMYGLMLNTKKAFAGEKDVDTIWLIGSNCRELLKAIPIAVRDDDNLEDILKTDKNEANVTMDVLDSCRYGCLCREVSDNPEPQEAQDAAAVAKAPDMNSKMLTRAWLQQNRPKKPNGFGGW